MKKLCVFAAILALFIVAANPVLGQRRPRITIAAASFQNNTGDQSLNYLKDSIPDQIITLLGRGGRVSIVERAALEQAIDELRLSRTEYLNPDKVVQVGKHVGASAIIVGSISKWATNTFSVNARLVSTETGLVMAAESVNGPQDDMLALCDDIAVSFRNVLLATPPPKPKSVFKKWWFWGGLLAAGGGAAYIISSSGGTTEEAGPQFTDVIVTVELP